MEKNIRRLFTFWQICEKIISKTFQRKKNLYNLILRIYLQYFVQGRGERLG